MNIANEVRPGGNRYVSYEGSVKELADYLKPFKKIAFVTGKKSFKIFSDYYQKEIDNVFYYDGTASYEDGERLSNLIGEADVVVGIGGGRVLDTAKITADNLKAETVLVPTLISNCAPFAPVAAVYYPNRSFRGVGYFEKSAYLTLVDPTLLLTTPEDYFVAGIGDTLAKWYEIEGILRFLNDEEKTAYIRLAVSSAKMIKELLLEDAEQGIEDLKNQQVTPAFIRLTDTIIALAAEVGGFGGIYGRSAGAHALHDGLSYLEETHEELHGKKVAYGILVQLAYTGDLGEIVTLLPFYDKVGLPTKLAELNVSNTGFDYLVPVLNHAVSPEESFVLLDSSITPEKLYEAIVKVESLGNK
ncbi:iron-containing alcohol dehydrogenase family protein [Vagococcus vulneris]|uniref:Alcohol dehydrogenase n=1 Tax=Vagococcus vulneris TaxID=1977869 RepID=A0A429ZZ56_9ENTE|nr:iron-containing alcohol dehydrogenase family protein [Vagococcus vulneris]RST99281.1 alcohol dehydrogenase [Vagococcus vulneris]